jgi:hypothetical protein
MNTTIKSLLGLAASMVAITTIGFLMAKNEKQDEDQVGDQSKEGLTSEMIDLDTYEFILQKINQ